MNFSSNEHIFLKIEFHVIMKDREFHIRPLDVRTVHTKRHRCYQKFRDNYLNRSTCKRVAIFMALQKTQICWEIFVSASFAISICEVTWYNVSVPYFDNLVHVTKGVKSDEQRIVRVKMRQVYVSTV